MFFLPVNLQNSLVAWLNIRLSSFFCVKFTFFSLLRSYQNIEDILIKSGEFSLPGKKALRTADSKYEVVIVDVTESPTERPKKNKNANTAAKKSGTQ